MTTTPRRLWRVSVKASFSADCCFTLGSVGLFITIIPYKKIDGYQEKNKTFTSPSTMTTPVIHKMRSTIKTAISCSSILTRRRRRPRVTQHEVGLSPIRTSQTICKQEEPEALKNFAGRIFSHSSIPRLYAPAWRIGRNAGRNYTASR